MSTLNRIVDEFADALSRPFDTLLKERLKLIIINERALLIRQSIGKTGIDKQFRQRYTVDISPVDKADSMVTLGSNLLRTNNKIATPVRYKTDTPFSYVGTSDGQVSYIYTDYSELKFISTLSLNASAIRYLYINGYLYLSSVDNIGLIGSITEFVDYNATVVGTTLVTSNTHGLYTNTFITISGTTNYDGTYQITTVDDNTFYIVKAYITNDATGTFAIMYLTIDAVYENPELIIPAETGANYTAGIVYNDDMEFPISLDLIQSIKNRLLSGELSIIDDKDKVTPTHIDNE